MLSIKRLTLLLLLAVAFSCSVKENRSDCPCCLGLDFSECTGLGGGLVLKGWGEGLGESFRSSPLPDTDGYGEYFVPRCDFSVLSISGITDIQDGRVEVDEGCQADSIYADIDRFSTRCEYCFRKLSLRKQFMTLRILTDEGPGDVSAMTVVSGTSGLSLDNLKGVPGVFSYCPQMVGRGVYSVRLFRQCDANLSLLVGAPDSDGLREIDISSLLDRCGYDWTEKSLRDVDLQVDLASCRVCVRIAGWEEKKEFSIEI